MLCAELEELEGEFAHVLAELENPDLTGRQRQELEQARSQLSHLLEEHQKSGHHGEPCFEE